MSINVVLGIDIGTSSSKGVLVTVDGRILRTATRAHAVSRPHVGWAEMSATVWWNEFVDICRELLVDVSATVTAVGVSGMGPCVVVADERGEPLRPAILYGVDMRARDQIARLTDELGGDEAIAQRGGSRLSTQSVGPKLAWLAEHEPEGFASTRMLFMPSSWLVWKLTGQYVLDHHSASQSSPLYETSTHSWYQPWARRIAPRLELPPLRWPGEVAGSVTARAAAESGLPAGTPVITGTIDAWSEAVSVGAQNPGDLMLMYGTTMFLVNTVPTAVRAPTLWGTTGAFPGTHCLAGGMATSGAITAWMRGIFGSPEYTELLEEAAESAPGANGLLMLPYFAGERTPIPDPDARGTLLGLSVTHTRGDLYRAALEATAFGVRHNIEAMRDAGGTIARVIAVGGGAQGSLWTQIVSDITGLDQLIPTHTVGASLGAAFLAANAIDEPHIDEWNPVATVRTPNPDTADLYGERYELYRRLYPATREITHALTRSTV